MDIDEAFAHPTVQLVLDAWEDSKHWEAAPFGGGVLGWPALMSDGLLICRQEETAIGDWFRHVEQPRG